MFNRQTLPFFGVIAAFLALAVIGLLTTGRQVQPSAAPGPSGAPFTSSPQTTEITDDITEPTQLGNFESLQAAGFSDTQSYFIDNSVTTYAQDQFPASSQLQILTDTITARDDGSTGFSVADGTNTRLFYVIATPLPGNQVKVDCYNI